MGLFTLPISTLFQAHIQPNHTSLSCTYCTSLQFIRSFTPLMSTNQRSGYPTPIHPSKTRIGWIGPGIMGSAMASRILSAGYSLTVFARTPSKASSLVSSGAELASSPSDLASRCDVIFSMVGHPEDVKNVILDPVFGAVRGAVEGSVFVDCTSSDPGLAREIDVEVRKKGCFAVDAPVSGGDVGARDGCLAILAGGERDVVEYLSPVFELLGKVTWMGPAGSGQSSKIANQILVASNLVGLTEGIMFARKAGLDAEKFVKAIGNGAAGSKVMEIFGERILKRDSKESGAMEYFVKDLGMALDRDKDKGELAVLPLTGLNRQMFLAMVASGDGKMGMQGLIRVLERMNGFNAN